MGETKDISIPQVIKSYPILAAAAAFFEPGLGQVLCGKIKRGILILVFASLATMSSSIMQGVFILLGGLLYFQASLTLQGLLYFLNPVSVVTSLFIRIWAVYDAHRIASNLKTV